MEAFVSNTSTLSSDSVRHAVPNAEVRLYKDGVLEATLHYDPDYESICNGNCGFRSSRYLSDRPVVVEYGATYHVEVSAPEYPNMRSELIVAEQSLQNVLLEAIVSDTLITYDISYIDPLPGVVIDTVRLQYSFEGDRNDLLQLELHWGHRIDSLAKYWIPIPENYPLPLSYDNDSLQLFTCPVFNTKENDMHIQYRTFSIDLVRYPEEYVAFKKEIRAQENSDVAGLYAASPTPIPTNMIDGFGYFFILEHHEVYYEVKQ